MNNTSKNSLLFAVAFSCLFITCCKNEVHQHTAADKKYHFGLHLESKATYYYTISNETRTKIEYNDKQTLTTGKSDIGLIYVIQNDSAGKYSLKLTYDTFHIVSGKDDDVKEITSSAGSYDPVEKLLAGLKGASVNITMNAQGRILGMSGSKEIADKLLAGMNAFDPQSGKMAQELVSRLAGESFVKGNVVQAFEMFPDSAVHVGDTWRRDNSSLNDLHYDAVSIYTLASVADGIARIKSASTIGTGKEAKMNLMGYDVTSNLTGEQTGAYEVDEKTGMVLKSQVEASMKGTLQILGKEVPVKINIARKVAAGKM